MWNVDNGSASLRLDVGGPDDLAPFLGFVGDQLFKVDGREREHGATEIGKPRLELGIGEASVDLRVELRNDLGRRGLRCADAVPEARLISRHELSEGRNVWQRFRAHRGGNRERTQLASPDVLD